MQLIVDAVQHLRLGEAIHFKNLTMFPILNGRRIQADYLVLDEALAAGYARVTEISETGSVPELKFVNSCKTSTPGDAFRGLKKFLDATVSDLYHKDTKTRTPV